MLCGGSSQCRRGSGAAHRHGELWAAQREKAGGSCKMRACKVPRQRTRLCEGSWGEPVERHRAAWRWRPGNTAASEHRGGGVGAGWQSLQHGSPWQPGGDTQPAWRRGLEKALKAEERPEMALRWLAVLSLIRCDTEEICLWSTCC